MKQFFRNILIKFFVNKHKYPPSTLIHRKKNPVIYEIEFNWFDESFSPVSIVREVKSNKIFSVREDEMLEFVEYSGANPNPGGSI